MATLAKKILMTHSLGGNTRSNAMRFSHNSMQGHHHSVMDVSRYADEASTRWSMSVGCLIDPESVASRYNRKAVHNRPVLGTGMLIGGQSTALVISDLHLPYQHRDAFDFLWALHQEYRFDRIWNVGDVFDHHRGSYHESEPDAMSEEQEFKMCKKYAQELQEMFPIMQIAQGNHDIIPQRKLKSVGLPMEMLKNFNQMYGLEETWEYKDRWWFDSDASYPVTVPMILKPNGRWDKNIPKVYGD